MNFTYVSELRRGRPYLRKIILECLDRHHDMFKRMYALNESDRKNPRGIDIIKVVDEMDQKKVMHAIDQAERVLDKIFDPKFINV